MRLRLAAYVAADRDREFDLATPPCCASRFFESAAIFIVCFSAGTICCWIAGPRSVVLKEVFALYEAFRKGEDVALPPLRPYGEYIACWISRTGGRPERYWRTSLKDFVAPTASGD